MCHTWKLPYLKYLLIILTASLVFSCQPHEKPSKKKGGSKPNIVVIYVDDLGYGDIGINGAKGVETPNIDTLSKHGLNFTDAHSSASTCTPSRYSLLTGSYAFRHNAAVLPGDAPLIINPGKGTLPLMLKSAGYTTGIVGKWHLGLGRGKVNWNKEISPGPREVGFDYSFIMPATADRVPCVFVEDQRVVGLDPNDPIEISYETRLDDYPIGLEHPDLLKQPADEQHSGTIVNEESRIGYMEGGEKALWKDEQFPIVLLKNAKQFMTKNKSRPFFLYFSFTDIHVPRLPNKKFVGKTTMGPRGDAIAQMDWCTGQLMKYLKDLGVADYTLVIFTSDNGPILDDGYGDKAVELVGSHKPGGPFRGAKYSILEAGTRMPTIVYWPGVVKPGKSNALLSQVDLYASLAHLVDKEVNSGHAPDSEDHLDAWLGKSKNGRTEMLEEAYTYALRKGDWKIIRPKTGTTPQWLENKDIETGFSDNMQLYNLKTDEGETRNVADENPEITKEMGNRLDSILTSSSTVRSTK